MDRNRKIAARTEKLEEKLTEAGLPFVESDWDVKVSVHHLVPENKPRGYKSFPESIAAAEAWYSLNRDADEDDEEHGEVVKHVS